MCKPRLLTAALVLLALSPLASSCATTAYYEREKLSDSCAQLDADPALFYIRNKLGAAREGAFGGFGTSVVGSCGCQ